jgi:hypothetical protein
LMYREIFFVISGTCKIDDNINVQVSMSLKESLIVKIKKPLPPAFQGNKNHYMTLHMRG